MRFWNWTALYVVAALVAMPLVGCGTENNSDEDEQPQQEFFQFEVGFRQFHYENFGPHSNQMNSPFGGVTILHDLPPGPYFFNCAIQLAPTQNQWQLRNVPIFGHGEPAQSYLPASWAQLQNATQQMQIQMVPSGHTLSKFPLLEPPTLLPPVPVTPWPLNYDTGIENSVFPPLPLPEDTPFLFDQPVQFPTITFECGMHANFTNQDCALCECCPAAVSNSLKTIGVSTMPGPMNMPPGGPLEIGDMHGPTGFMAGSGTAIDWWTTKGPALMMSHGVTTTNTPIPAGAGAGPTAMRVTVLCDMLAALNAGKDVEVQNGHHIGMVTGIYKLTVDGVTTYTIDVAHDTNQGNAGGTVNETLGYDPATNMLSGGVAGFFRNTAPTHFTVETKP
jgi:hypothetical protein